VAVRHNLDGDAFVLGAVEGAGDARLEAADQLVFLDDGEPDQHQRAVAKQNGITLMTGPKRQRRRRNDIPALHARDINALAEEERTCRHLALRCGCGCCGGYVGHKSSIAWWATQGSRSAAIFETAAAVTCYRQPGAGCTALVAQGRSFRSRKPHDSYRG